MTAVLDSTSHQPTSPAPLREDAHVIGLVGVGHGLSHFFQLIVAPLFPWIKPAFGLSYAQLGLIMALFFTVSCIGQFWAGFVVDRFGARRVLLCGLACFVVAGLGLAASLNYPMLLLFSALAGLGNCVFHPADFSILNARVSKSRLGHAYSVHGITGSLGWATAPIFLVGIANLASWRIALLSAAILAAAVLALLFWQRRRLDSRRERAAHAATAAPADHPLAFLRLPAVWMCFFFFFAYSISLGGIQSFMPEAARQLHAIPLGWVALCVSIYMLAAAGGMVVGGFLVADPRRCDRVVAIGFGVAATMALAIGLGHWPAALVPVMFGVMGFGAGLAGPSRDLLVKQAAPENATGRVYGVVYSGLDVGMALAPLMFGSLMDGGHPAAVWVIAAGFQGLLIASAFRVQRIGRARRAGPAPVAVPAR
jgi:FSR family fosmidomycin resistance protein-like MFS transporter